MQFKKCDDYFSAAGKSYLRNQDSSQMGTRPSSQGKIAKCQEIFVDSANDENCGKLAN
jgi:hypothetical protein